MNDPLSLTHSLIQPLTHTIQSLTLLPSGCHIILKHVKINKLDIRKSPSITKQKSFKVAVEKN